MQRRKARKGQEKRKVQVVGSAFSSLRGAEDQRGRRQPTSFFFLVVNCALEPCSEIYRNVLQTSCCSQFNTTRPAEADRVE